MSDENNLDINEQSPVKVKRSFKARLLAAWEWFKSAAWLQVLLIVAIVVGLVVAIPFIVSAISDASKKINLKFYKNNRITYAQLEKFIDGSDSKCNGVIGTGEADPKDDKKFLFSQDKEGFVVLVYKSNCENCNTMQKKLEDWYTTFKKDYSNETIKFYTLDVSWICTGSSKDASKTEKKEGERNDYDNNQISLEQQMELQAAIRDVYLDHDITDEIHTSDTVTQDILQKDLTEEHSGGTIPTPCFITYTKDKSAKNYIDPTLESDYQQDKEHPIKYCKPSKVVFGNLKDLSVSDAKNIATQMADIYFFKEWTGLHN